MVMRPVSAKAIEAVKPEVKRPKSSGLAFYKNIHIRSTDPRTRHNETYRNRNDSLVRDLDVFSESTVLGVDDVRTNLVFGDVGAYSNNLTESFESDIKRTSSRCI